MPNKQNARQRKAMKKRRKEKARRKKEALTKAQSSPRALVKRARQYPIKECLINEDWDTAQTSNLVRIWITRELPDGTLILGSYLVDRLCLGLKDTFYKTNLPLSQYYRLIDELFFDVAPQTCPPELAPELAHQMIYEGIDYAAQFDLKPHKDFELSRYILEKRGTLDTPYSLTFGIDGKPMFASGPYDDEDAILAKLRKHAGQGNFYYLTSGGSFLPEDDVGNTDPS